MQQKNEAGCIAPSAYYKEHQSFGKEASISSSGFLV